MCVYVLFCRFVFLSFFYFSFYLSRCFFVILLGILCKLFFILKAIFVYRYEISVELVRKNENFSELVTAFYANFTAKKVIKDFLHGI